MRETKEGLTNEGSPARAGDGVDDNQTGGETVIERYRNAVESAADPGEALLGRAKAHLMEIADRIKSLWDGVEQLRPESWVEDARIRSTVLQMYLPVLRQFERFEQVSLRHTEIRLRAARSIE